MLNIPPITPKPKPIKRTFASSHNRNGRRRSERIQNKNKQKLRSKEVPLIDLSNDNEQNDEDDDEIISNNSSNTNNKMSVDEDSDDVDIQMNDDSNNNNNNKQIIEIDEEEKIDIDDIELPLIGIAIGKHTDFWSTNTDDQRPKIVINKHSNSIDLFLKSICCDYVNVSIPTKQIKSLFIPTNSSFFELSQLNVSHSNKLDDIHPYIQCIFLQTFNKLAKYAWLDAFYDPNNMKHAGIERITLMIGNKHYNKFKQIVMNKLYCCELRNAVKHTDEHEKRLWLKHISFGRSVKRKWKVLDTQKTEEHIDKLLNPQSSQSDEDNDQIDIFSEDDNCNETDDDKNDKDTIDITADDSLSNSLQLEMNEIDKKYQNYVQNSEILSTPHHANSLLYAQNYTTEPYKTLECFWVFPAQHEHRQNINNIESKDYAKVTIDDEYLNDSIIDFQSKYTYSSWPASFKENVYIFTSFFWKKLIKIKDNKNMNKETVKQLFRWTKHIKSIFDKKYLIIPKCENLHWELIIICFAGKVIKQYQMEQSDEDDEDMEEDAEEKDFEQPCIAILDSMNGNRKASDFKLIRKWLNLEAENMKKDKSESLNDDDLVEYDEIFTLKTITGYCVKVPRQPNCHDCGCFLLRNLLQFGYDEGFKDTSSKKAFGLSEWYPAMDGVAYRKEIASILARLIAEQEAFIQQRKDEFKKKKMELARKRMKNKKEKMNKERNDCV